MCVLCGELILSVHWSDDNASENREIIAGEQQRFRAQNRLEKAELSDKILRFYGLSVRDWNLSKYTLSDKKGHCVMVHSLGDLWEKADQMSSKKIDVLDNSFLNYLKTCYE